MLASIQPIVDNETNGTEYWFCGNSLDKQIEVESGQNGNDIELKPVYTTVKGAVTDVFTKQIMINRKNLLMYDNCDINDISVGDLVIVETNIENEVTVKPLNESIITAKIVSYEKELNRLIVSGQCGQAYIQKTSLTAGYKVGDCLKCSVIQTNADHPYTWRAHSTELVIEKADSIDDLKKVVNSSPMMAENLFDISKCGLRQFDDDYELVYGDVPWTQSSLDFQPIGKYDIPEDLWNVMSYKKNGWQLKKQFREYKQVLNETNYQKKFQTLLWMEELQNTINLNRYDMYDIKIEIDGYLFAIYIPGLGEGRPSLILGDKVLIFEDNKRSRRRKSRNKKRLVFEGYINEIDGKEDEILVSFGNRLMDEFDNRTKYNLIFQLGRMIYRRRHYALDLVSQMSEQILFPTDVKLRRPLKERSIKKIKWFNQSLNKQQKLAVYGTLRAECRPTPYIIFGPPGTGKTVTIVESILQVFHNLSGSRIIACAATNNSADLIAQKLLDSRQITDTDLIRVSAFHRINSVPKSLSGVTQVADDNYEKWLNFRVIVTTITQAGIIYKYSSYIDRDHFTHAFVDEAAQVMEPESLIPITLSAIGNGVVVLAGDYKQLGPVIQSPKAKEGGLHLSLMERLMTNFKVYERNELHKEFGYYNPKFVVKLVNNYRSDPQIMTLPSKWFYDNELEFNVKKDHKLIESLKLGSAVIFQEVNGADRQDRGCTSWYNPSEIFEVFTYLEKLYKAGVKPEDIGIITPYRKQVSGIKDYIYNKGLDECSVATIEKFQGLEKRVIIVSMVRSLPTSFTRDPKRLNVAISRAKSLLIIIGNPKNLTRVQYWSEFVDYCAKHKCYYRSKAKQSVANTERTKYSLKIVILSNWVFSIAEL